MQHTLTVSQAEWMAAGNYLFQNLSEMGLCTILPQAHTTFQASPREEMANPGEVLD